MDIITFQGRSAGFPAFVIRGDIMMKKIWSLMIAAVLMFSATACGANEEEISSAGSDLSDDTQNEQETPLLSELFESYEGSENLFVYTGDSLSDLSYPEYIICDRGILLYDTCYTESGDSSVKLVLFDPSDGSLLSSAEFSCEFLTDIRQTDAGLMLCDSSLGFVLLLDEELSVLDEWTFEPDYEYWYVGESGEDVYLIEEGSLIKTELESGNEEVLLTSSVSLYGGESINGGALITYVDDETYMTCQSWLDLSSGELVSCGFDEAISFLTYSDGIWLAQTEDTLGTEFILGTDENAVIVTIEEGDLVQVDGSDDVFYYSGEENYFALYDEEGEFISSFSIDQEDAWYYSDFCRYSDIYEGYFLIIYTDDGPMLFFWDTSGEESGEGLNTASYEGDDSSNGGTAVSAVLYERACELSGEYGIDILIADQCETEYDDFIAEQETDEALISEGLDTIEAALSNYPEGFIEQLKYDKVTGIQINLCGTLTPTNENWGEESYNGLTEEHGNKNIIAVDLSQFYEDTVYHEISHIIDSYLEWNTYCREDAVFSEECWEALNPEGFEYTYVYSGFEEILFEGDEYMYFIDVYSMISPTEDRARILEYAMAGYDDYFTEFEPTYAKLLYYCECIRDAFDTEGWPAQTAWEDVG